jgi:hypothetical protein
MTGGTSDGVQKVLTKRSRPTGPVWVAAGFGEDVSRGLVVGGVAHERSHPFGVTLGPAASPTVVPGALTAKAA